MAFSPHAIGPLARADCDALVLSSYLSWVAQDRVAAEVSLHTEPPQPARELGRGEGIAFHADGET